MKDEVIDLVEHRILWNLKEDMSGLQDCWASGAVLLTMTRQSEVLEIESVLNF